MGCGFEPPLGMCVFVSLFESGDSNYETQHDASENCSGHWTEESFFLIDFIDLKYPNKQSINFIAIYNLIHTDYLALNKSLSW